MKKSSFFWEGKEEVAPRHRMGEIPERHKGGLDFFPSEPLPFSLVDERLFLLSSPVRESRLPLFFLFKKVFRPRVSG